MKAKEITKKIGHFILGFISCAVIFVGVIFVRADTELESIKVYYENVFNKKIDKNVSAALDDIYDVINYVGGEPDGTQVTQKIGAYWNYLFDSKDQISYVETDAAGNKVPTPVDKKIKSRTHYYKYYKKAGKEKLSYDIADWQNKWQPLAKAGGTITYANEEWNCDDSDDSGTDDCVFTQSKELDADFHDGTDSQNQYTTWEVNVDEATWTKAKQVKIYMYAYADNENAWNLIDSGDESQVDTQLNGVSKANGNPAEVIPIITITKQPGQGDATTKQTFTTSNVDFNLDKTVYTGSVSYKKAGKCTKTVFEAKTYFVSYYDEHRLKIEYHSYAKSGKETGGCLAFDGSKKSQEAFIAFSQNEDHPYYFPVKIKGQKEPQDHKFLYWGRNIKGTIKYYVDTMTVTTNKNTYSTGYLTLKARNTNWYFLVEYYMLGE